MTRSKNLSLDSGVDPGNDEMCSQSIGALTRSAEGNYQEFLPKSSPRA